MGEGIGQGEGRDATHGDLPRIPNEEEVQEKYDELYQESPYKANIYLEEVKATRSSAFEQREQARIDRAVNDFYAVCPECTEEDWAEMNNPAFWRKHEDIRNAKDRGDVFATLVTAYTRLSQSRLEKQMTEFSKQAEEKKTKQDKKKSGQVLRTSVKPVPKKKAKEPTKEETNAEYIAKMRKDAMARMRIAE